MNNSHDEINRLIKDENYESAEKQARDFIQATPNDFNALVLLGRVLGIQGKYDEAKVYFDEAYVLDADQHQLVYYLGITHENLDEHDQAIEYYRKILWSEDYGTEANYRLGLICADRSKGMYDSKQAKQYFLKATQSEKPIEEAFLELAVLETGKRSVNVLLNGLKVFPNSVRLYTRLANYYLNRLKDYQGCIDTIGQAKSEAIDNDDLRFVSVLAYYHLGYFELAYEALTNLDDEYSNEIKNALKCIKAILFMEQEKYSEAEAILSELITQDFGNKLQYAAHIIAMCCNFRRGNTEVTETYFNEIPNDEEFSELTLMVFPLGVFPIDKYFIEALGLIIDKNTSSKVVAKARGIRALYKSYLGTDIEWEIIHEDISVALQQFPESTVLNQLMGHSYQAQAKPFEAIKYYVTAQVNTDEQLWINYQELLDSAYKGDKFVPVLNEIGNIVKQDSEALYSKFKKRFSENLLEQLIEFLHNHNLYEQVVEICEWFDYSQLLEAEVLFELAFAYKKIGNSRRSKMFYEAYIRDQEPTSAACNNLGILYEEEGDFKKAEELLRQALELDPNNEHAPSNLQRVQEKIKAGREKKKAYNRAVALYFQENKTVRRAIAKIYALRDTEGIVLCHPSEAADLLKIRSSEAYDQINEYVGKKYFDEAGDVNLPFDGIILKVNPELLPTIEQELITAKEEEFVEQLVVEMSPDSLEQKYEYGSFLINQLSTISSPELVSILERDLREAVLALATQSYKSALVLCGSIVEAVLMDRLLAREPSAIASFDRLQQNAGQAIRAKDKKISSWSLSTLLDVAREENMISNNLYHWGHGIRGFRNLIHPAVEQRKEMEVSRENGEVAWSVVKRLLKEIS